MATTDQEQTVNHDFPSRIHAAVTPELADAVRAKARREGCSVSALIRRTLRDELDDLTAQEPCAMAA